MPASMVLQLVLVGLYGAVVCVLFLAVPVVAVRSRPLPALRLGMAFAALVLLLQLPGIGTHALYYDPGPLLDDEMAPPLVKALGPDLAWTMLWAGVGSALVMAAWRVVLVPATVVVHDTPAFPWVDRERPFPWTTALGVGLGLGVASMLLDFAFGAGPDSIAREAPDLFPGLPTSWPTRLALGATGGLAAVIAEGLLFRGFLQRALLRWLPPAAAIGLAALVVGCGQALTPHLPFLAVAEGTWIGGALGALAWRHGLEASLMAHGVLVVLVTVGGLLW